MPLGFYSAPTYFPCALGDERLWIWFLEPTPRPMTNTYVFQVARNQRSLILVTSTQLVLYQYPHALMHKYICSPMLLCASFPRWIADMSLWMELVLETLHISPALVFCSSVGSTGTSTCSFCRLGGR